MLTHLIGKHLIQGIGVGIIPTVLDMKMLDEWMSEFWKLKADK